MVRTCISSSIQSLSSKSEQQWQMLTAAYFEEFPEIAASNAKKDVKSAV